MPAYPPLGSNHCCDVLVVKLSALGDVIHALGAVSVLKGHPVRLWWLTKPAYLPLLEGVSFVHGVLTPSELFRAKRRFHVALDLQGLLKSAVFTLFASERVGFCPTEAREPLASLFYTRRLGPYGGHVVERLRRLVCDAFGVKDTGIYDFGLAPSPSELERAKSRVSVPFILLIPSAAWPTKGLTPFWCARFIHLWSRASSLPVYIMTGLGDGWRFEGFPSLLPGLSLREAMAVISLASLVVAPDTGFLHMAAALGVPCVGLFCCTDPSRNGPFPRGHVVLCRCSAAGCWKRECPSLCTPSIDPEEVVEVSLRALREAGHGVHRP